MEETVKIGDRFNYDWGDELYSFPVETVVFYIDGETAILKVIGMSAECEELTLKYDDVVEFYPDFTDPERNSNSRYLFLDMGTLDLFDDPYAYYYWEEQEDDESSENSEDIDENAEWQSSASDSTSDDLPF